MGGGFGNQSDRQEARRIQTTLNKCYAPKTMKKWLINDEEVQSRISDCVGLMLKHANAGCRVS